MYQIYLDSRTLQYLILVCCYSFVLAKSDPFQLFKRHQILKPIYFDSGLKQVSSNQVPCAQLRFLRLMKQEHPFISIRLRHNNKLVSSDFFVKFQQNDSHLIETPKLNIQSDCHFNGELLNLDFTYFDTELTGDEQVVINTHNGTTNGMIEIGREDYFLHFDAKSGTHVLFSELNESNGSGAVNSSQDHNFKAINSTEHRRVRRSMYSSLRRIFGFHNESVNTRYLELILVNDKRQYLDHSNDLVQRNLAIVNYINSYYNLVNIYVVLTGLIIWNERDEIEITNNSSQVLEHFLIYRKDKLLNEYPNDNAQLISGISFAYGTVGKALVGPICSYESSGGINSDHVAIAALVASTVAHELGHNFGLQHDNATCFCPDSKCLMTNSSTGFRPKHWSDCSLNAFKDAFDRGMDSCMYNVPTKVVESVCGNGILEEGEECDCGMSIFCKNQQCCDMKTCKLTANSTCGTGTCCDYNTCQPYSVLGKKCRIKKSVCDIPEYCDGESEFCPLDIHIGNGVKCESDGVEAYCYDGECKSHESQCKLLWGQTAKVSNLTCWKQNLNGKMAANCGTRHHLHNKNDTYLKCNLADIYCGRLHCNHDADELKYGWKGAANQMQILMQKVVVCSSAIIDMGLDVMDPGLVPNGAKCGDNRMCINQKCVPIVSQCENNCYGNGICKSDGQCLCQNGFYPPNCQYSFGSRILLGIYVIFLGILPTAGLIIGAFLYYQEQLKTWWIIRKRKASIKNRVKRDASQGSFRSRSQARNKRFAVDLKQIEISQPVPIHNGVAITLCTQTSSSAYSDSQNVNNHVSDNSESLRMKPIRPAPPPPPSQSKKLNFDNV